MRFLLLKRRGIQRNSYFLLFFNLLFRNHLGILRIIWNLLVLIDNAYLCFLHYLRVLFFLQLQNYLSLRDFLWHPNVTESLYLFSNLSHGFFELKKYRFLHLININLEFSLNRLDLAHLNISKFNLKTCIYTPSIKFIYIIKNKAIN